LVLIKDLIFSKLNNNMIYLVCMVQSCNTMDTWHHLWFYMLALYTRSVVAERKVEAGKDLNW